MRKAAREKMGTEGEDVVADPSGGLKLRMPMRMGIGTVKAAAWHVRCRATLPTPLVVLCMSSMANAQLTSFCHLFMQLRVCCAIKLVRPAAHVCTIALSTGLQRRPQP